MAVQVGERVGALRGAENGVVSVFGFGTYLGRQIPDPTLGVRAFGQLIEHPNPCIQLDSGKLVFGCECWWGPEDAILQRVAMYRVQEDADIDDYRREAAELDKAEA